MLPAGPGAGDCHDCPHLQAQLEHCRQLDGLPAQPTGQAGVLPRCLHSRSMRPCWHGRCCLTTRQDVPAGRSPRLHFSPHVAVPPLPRQAAPPAALSAVMPRATTRAAPPWPHWRCWACRVRRAWPPAAPPAAACCAARWTPGSTLTSWPLCMLGSTQQQRQGRRQVTGLLGRLQGARASVAVWLVLVGRWAWQALPPPAGIAVQQAGHAAPAAPRRLPAWRQVSSLPQGRRAVQVMTATTLRSAPGPCCASVRARSSF